MMNTRIRALAGPALLAAAAVTALAGPASAHTAAIAPAGPAHAHTAAITLSGRVTVPRVAYERVTVSAGQCITDVSAYADSADGSGTVWSPADHSRGARHVLRLHFTRDDPAGRWYVTDVFYRRCGQHRTRDLVGTRFPQFTVTG